MSFANHQSKPTHLKAECGARYWEDATIDGVEDADGSRIPCRVGDFWSPVIDLATGIILGWPKGLTAKIHYKVCDNGTYTLVDAGGAEIRSISGYVPKIMCPGGTGFGDYVIMRIDGSGRIEDWHPDLTPFD